MPIGIDDHHIELAESLRAWAKGQSTTDAVRAAEGSAESLAKWSGKVAEMGLTTIALPEPFGGGGSLLDQAVALEAAAYGLVPGGLLSTTLAGLLVDDVDLRAGIATGEITVGVGLLPSLEVHEDRLAGAVAAVADAPTGTHVLVGGADRWFVVPVSMVTVDPGMTPDLSRSVGSVTLAVPLAHLVEVDVDAAGVRRLLVRLAAAWDVSRASNDGLAQEEFATLVA
ncbi:MAG: acyl-CoA dehydrogenase family protein, partial [Marmoricola sp.]